MYRLMNTCTKSYLFFLLLFFNKWLFFNMFCNSRLIKNTVRNIFTCFYTVLWTIIISNFSITSWIHQQKLNWVFSLAFPNIKHLITANCILHSCCVLIIIYMLINAFLKFSVVSDWIYNFVLISKNSWQAEIELLKDSLE